MEKDILYPLRRVHGKMHEWKIHVWPVVKQRVKKPEAVFLIMTPEHDNLGDQALDIGHLDVEYEWYLRKVNDRVALPGKFTNEVSDGDAVSDCDDPEYQRQIVAKVGMI